MKKTAIPKTAYNPEEAIRGNIPKNGTVILGLSGGPDSMYLLHLCLKTTKKHPFKIVVAHVNHGLRGAESDRDELFCKKTAAKHNLEFESVRIAQLPKNNLEEAFREFRYAFFTNLRESHKADWILTGHHLNDNLETVLLNFTRGAFVDGLSGMSVCDHNRKILRPLLPLTKEKILAAAKKINLKYRVDKSNFNTDLSRNLIRHEIIPRLKKINSGLETTFYHNIATFTDLQEYLEKKTSVWLGINSKRNGVVLERFLTLEPFMQKHVLFHLYKNKYGNTKKLSREHIVQIMDILQKKQAGLKKEFGSDYEIAIVKPVEEGQRYIQILKKKGK